jgi:hypothetical protein
LPRLQVWSRQEGQGKMRLIFRRFDRNNFNSKRYLCGRCVVDN